MTTKALNTSEYFKHGIDCFLSSDPKKLDEALEVFNKIASENEEHESFLYYLGSTYMRKKEFGVAMILLKKAIELKENFPEAHNNLGWIYRELGMRDLAVPHFERAVEINPEEEAYLINMASAYSGNSTPDICIEYCQKVLDKTPENKIAMNNLAISFLEKGEWEKGFKNYWTRLEIEDRKRRNYHYPDHTPEWNGERGRGATVVVWGEQGLGDEIMFASCLPDAMQKATIILDAHERLADIFRNSFPNLAVYGTRKKNEIVWPSQHNRIDYQIAIGDLCRLFRKTDEDFPKTPYLVAEDRYIKLADERLKQISDKPKIGISWMGGTHKTHMDQRHIELEKWLPIFTEFKDNVDFISLQYHQHAGQIIAEFEEKNPGIKIYHWKDILDDYDMTAGLVECLDLIVSIPQSVVHLAGALGVPVWQLTPKKALWQMGPYGKDMPWYGCVKNIWQEVPGEWEPVLEEVRKRLCSLFQTTIEN